jgi:hypothetical protein
METMSALPSRLAAGLRQLNNRLMILGLHYCLIGMLDKLQNK